MQTFLPWPDPRESAAALDDRRLGKQRVETFQVLRALTWPTYGWKNHPATRMWRGFVPGLVAYGLACVDEWRALAAPMPPGPRSSSSPAGASPTGLAPTTPAPLAREGTGAVSSSVARQPTEADRLAMAEEAVTRPEFRFVRRFLVTPELGDDLGAGLVVTPRAADPGPTTGRPRLVLPWPRGAGACTGERTAYGRAGGRPDLK